MGTLAKSYDLAQVQCILGGVIVGGYGEEGGLEIAPAADGPFTASTGADDLTVFSKTNNTDSIATITVSEKAASYAGLGALMKVQANGLVPVIVPLFFSLFDPSSGETVTSAYPVFVQRPTVTKGRVAGERIFVVHLPGAATSTLYAPLNIAV